MNADVHEISVIQVPEEDPVFNPLGVKGIGELTMVGRLMYSLYQGMNRFGDFPVGVTGKLMIPH